MTLFTRKCQFCDEHFTKQTARAIYDHEAACKTPWPCPACAYKGVLDSNKGREWCWCPRCKKDVKEKP